MSSLNLGVQGAKRQTYLKSPRPLLRSIIEANGGKTGLRDKIREAFLSAVRNSVDCDSYLEAALEYWFHNHFNAMTRDNKKLKERNARSATAKERLKQAVKANLTLGSMMPNGKTLRNCTGEECITMGRMFGNFIVSIGKSINPKQKVGSVYRSDSQIKKFWDSK